VKLLSWLLTAMALLAPGRDHTALAQAIAEVADDVATASTMVAIAFRESSFDNAAVGDHGASKCAFQLWGVSDEALRDPKFCARIALERIRASQKLCPAHPLAIYAAGPGGCTNKRAQRISRDRTWLAARLVKEVQP
jgi:hypothetical protein